ncbi:MAG: hypothetical protein OEW30_16690, partial [Acidimicrobiia bacterium]|nr:hypothetical protein [Acidimicrobiia bacterium]
MPALDSESTLVAVFAAADYFDAPEPFLDLSEAFPTSVVVGCSTAGEISGGRVHDDTIVVAICKFDTATLRLASASIDRTSMSRSAGASIARDLASPDLRSVLGLSVN